MTFEQIVAQVADRLNLTSDDALARIGDSVNERYGWVCTSMGLQTSVQEVAEADTVIGDQFLTFGDEEQLVIKLEDMFNEANPRPNMLNELDLTLIRNMVPGTDPAQNYAMYRMGAGTVTVMLDVVPASIYTLSADVIVDKAVLADDDIPTFAAPFHNLLVYGAMATELDKTQNYDMAAVQEQRYQDRCSELRLFIAKSAYKDIYQGRLTAGMYPNRLV